MRCVLKDLISLSKDGEWGKSDSFAGSVEMFAIRGTDFEDVRFGEIGSVPRRHIPGPIAARKALQPWDVLIEAAGGTKDQITGRTALLRPELFGRSELPLTCASFSRFIRFNMALCDPAYMFWHLQYLYAAGFMNAYHTQHTGVSRFQWTTFSEREPIEIPALPVQRRIGSILSAYDELIENNRRRIQILEQMARAIYREWFVEFRFPGHETVPRVQSALGEVPQDWQRKPLQALMTNHIGGGWGKDSADEDHSEPAWVIRGTDIPEARRCQVAEVPHRFHSLSNLRSRQLQCNDIVFEVSGGSKGQPVGRTLLVTSQLLSAFGDDAVICASFCKRVRPNVALYRAELFYLSFIEGYESGEVEQFQVQSTGISNFKWTDYITNIERMVPPLPLQDRFRAHVSPLFAQIGTLGLEIFNLRKTRDLLLSRLLSGQVAFDVPAA